MELQAIILVCIDDFIGCFVHVSDPYLLLSEGMLLKDAFMLNYIYFCNEENDQI